MEIDSNRSVPPATAANGQVAPVDNKHNKDDANQKHEPTGSTGQVSLTSEARQLNELEKAVADQPVVDTKRVEAVREAIATDTFNVDAERIAEKLVQIEDILTDAR